MLFNKQIRIPLYTASVVPFFIHLFFVVSLPNQLFAEATSYRAKIRSFTGITNLVASSQAASVTEEGTVRSIAPVRTTFSVKGVGVVTATFDKQWVPQSRAYFDDGQRLIPDQSKALFLRGTISLRQRSRTDQKRVRVNRPVSATVFFKGDEAAQTVVSFIDQNREGHSARLYEVKIPPKFSLRPDMAVVHNVPARIFNGMKCGTSAAQGVEGEHQKAARAAVSLKQDEPLSPQATVRVVQVSTDADYEWYQKYGSNSFTQITSMLNMVSTIYEAQLGLTIEVGTQLAVTTPGTRYLQTDASLLLDEFRSYTNTNQHLGSADLYHLFSGKEWDGDTLGIAFVGVTCLAPTFSYGATQDVSSSLKGIITAHEIGHNFDANHDNSLPTTIMSAAVNISSLPTQFSNLSVSEITNFVSTNNSCLSFKSITPSPTPTIPAGSTPTPVATPGNGGGGGGSPIAPTPMPIQLGVSVSRSGLFSSTISLSNPSSECTVGVRASSVQKKVTKGALVLSTSGASAEQRFEFTLARKVKKRNARRKTQYAYLIAEQSCTGSTPSYSPVVTLEPFRIVVADRPITLKQWLRELRDQFSSSTPAS